MMELTTVEKSAFEELVKQCTRSGSIDPSLYVDYDVKRGLRDSNGNGVLTGLTEISDVVGTRSDNGRKVLKCTLLNGCQFHHLLIVHFFLPPKRYFL